MREFSIEVSLQHDHRIIGQVDDDGTVIIESMRILPAVDADGNIKFSALSATEQKYVEFEARKNANREILP